MKKIIAVYLCLVFTLSLCACGSIPTQNGENATITEQQSENNKETTEKETNRTVYEDEIIKVEYYKAEEVYDGQANFYLKVENKTDKDLLVGFGDLSTISINDNSLQILGGAIVKANKTGVVYGSFRMDYAGIETIDDIKEIEFGLHVSDNETFETVEEVSSIKVILNTQK